jgi:hypothetical protein
MHDDYSYALALPFLVFPDIAMHAAYLILHPVNFKHIMPCIFSQFHVPRFTLRKTPNRAYIDIEVNVERPVEIGIVIANNKGVVLTSRMLFKIEKPTPSELFASKYVHGIDVRDDSRKVYDVTDMLFILKLLHDNNVKTIVANGYDIEILLEHANIPFQQVDLGNWDIRSIRAFHMKALLTKDKMLGKDYNCCDKSTHAKFHRSPKSPTTSTQVLKFAYGYHCAIVDALEMYYMQKQLDPTMI